MRYIFTPEPVGSFACDAVADGVWLKETDQVGKSYLPDDVRAAVVAELKRRGFEGREGDVIALSLLGQSKIKQLIVAGLGERGKIRPDQFRTLAARILKTTNGLRAKQLYAHERLLKAVKDQEQAAQMWVEGVELASYHFHSFRKHTAAEEAKKRTAVEVLMPMNPDKNAQKKIQNGVDRGVLLAQATELARDLVNTPSLNMHPHEMAERAKALAGRGTNVTCRVLGRADMERLGMHAALAIGQGSQHEPKFVHLTYRPPGKAKKKIALVGKAVTFDSGGLSLKPAEHMTDMKIDMAGAASVLGVFKALPKLAPKAEVHGVFIAVENMPSGSACRPGDVVAAMDGTTIEIENTDAEGRVTLADALAFAALKIKPDAIVDLATLTGAVIIALGSDVTGFFATDKDLKRALQQASQESGEPMWELPLYKPYAELIKSKIADVRNVGGRPAGIITSALFLEKFVHGVPWAHLDIAGPSYAEKETRAEWPAGGTGWGVRTLLNYLNQIQ